MNGTLLFETPLVTIEFSKAFVIPGYLFVSPKRKIRNLEELTVEEFREIGECILLATKVIRTVVDPLNIYCAKFGESNFPLHFHILPRTQWLTDLYKLKFPELDTIAGPVILDWVSRDFLKFNSRYPIAPDYDDINKKLSLEFEKYSLEIDKKQNFSL